MKKINNRGFVLAETLIVAVFLMVIFGMLYSNFYPLIGEYEKREAYDDVDSKYSIYWIKKMIEDSSYYPADAQKQLFSTKKVMRFKCSDVGISNEKQSICKNLVQELEVDGCDNEGNNCSIFITDYNLTNFKETVEKQYIKNWEEECSKTQTECKNLFIDKCTKNYVPSSAPAATKTENCTTKAGKSIFDTGFEDYIMTLPDYKVDSINGAKYRVIARFRHRKDGNSYYSYATIEVNR